MCPLGRENFIGFLNGIAVKRKMNRDFLKFIAQFFSYKSCKYFLHCTYIRTCRIVPQCQSMRINKDQISEIDQSSCQYSFTYHRPKIVSWDVSQIFNLGSVTNSFKIHLYSSSPLQHSCFQVRIIYSHQHMNDIKKT